jgi:hypothetical protein
VSSNVERLVGVALWQGGKWYLRRRLPSRRRVLTAGLLTVATIAALAAIAKRGG